MKDKTGKSQASEAIDDYLELLLSSDEPMGCEQVSEPHKDTNLYHLDSRRDIERVGRLLDDFNLRQRNTEAEEIVPETKVQAEPVVLLQPTMLQPVQLDQTTEQEASEEDINEEEAEQSEQAIESEQSIEKTTIWIPEDQELVREDWSKQPFQTLLFEVAGLSLALPLIKLGGIHRIDGEITPLFGKPDWFLGLLPGHNSNINIVDTTRWVMPEKYQQAEETGLNYQFIILLGDSNWGLACSNVRNAISLLPENVRWRATAGKRPWLAGMLIDEMCALLDVDTLIYLLEENFPR